MRNVFCKSLVAQARRPDFVFLTGDLGYKALEPLRDAMGERFLNAGIAEQNMVSVVRGAGPDRAAPWVYSIAPFVYARPFEQIRNDICLHGFPVVLVGNGGGYAYGVMVATHHAIEDYGVLLGLPGLRAYVPAFDSDVEAMVPKLFAVVPSRLLPARALGAAGGGRGATLCALAKALSRRRCDRAGRRSAGRGHPCHRTPTRTRPAGRASGCSPSCPPKSYPPSVPRRPATLRPPDRGGGARGPRRAGPDDGLYPAGVGAGSPSLRHQDGRGLCLGPVRVPEIPPIGERPRRCLRGHARGGRRMIC